MEQWGLRARLLGVAQKARKLIGTADQVSTDEYLAMIDGHTHGMGEFCKRIRDEMNSLRLLRFLPRLHHVGVVHGRGHRYTGPRITRARLPRLRPRGFTRCPTQKAFPR